MEDTSVSWRVRAIRGATTASENSVDAIREVVHELIDAIETENTFDYEEIISVTFSVTWDLDAIFPAAITRERSNWDNVPLLDVQQMHVESDLDFCIRCLIHFNTAHPEQPIHHIYQRGAKNLRPDWGLVQARVPSTLPSPSAR
ncbi:MAG: chorismate mutase [Acaryochloris sp. RU_4_1]|nr:chorismate mutase [Acaryochloris sp. RU_4_1]NJR54461.1 chorismate mutase [Acaryochloris sp. CRU_2_0]